MQTQAVRDFLIHLSEVIKNPTFTLYGIYNLSLEMSISRFSVRMSLPPWEWGRVSHASRMAFFPSSPTSVHRTRPAYFALVARSIIHGSQCSFACAVPLLPPPCLSPPCPSPSLLVTSVDS